jgi:hypothetical protein
MAFIIVIACLMSFLTFEKNQIQVSLDILHGIFGCPSIQGILSIQPKVKAYYTIHKMLSQDSFYKILGFVIGHLIKYNYI